MIVVMFVSLLLSSVTVIREKVSKAYFRNFISPTKSVLFILATFITNISIIIIQLLIVFAVMAVIQPTITNTLFQVALSILIITSAFILLGMIIGYFFSSEETATIGAISIGSILLFFSNTIIPLETLSSGVQKVVDYNMFVASDAILRNVIIFNLGLKESISQIYILLIHIIVFVVVLAVVYKISSQIFNIKKYWHK